MNPQGAGHHSRSASSHPQPSSSPAGPRFRLLYHRELAAAKERVPDRPDDPAGWIEAIREADLDLAHRIEGCGRMYYKARCGCSSSSGRHAIPRSCSARLCPRCERRRAAKAIARYSQVLEAQAGRPRFLTLTIRRADRDGLRESIEFVRAAWKRLRRRLGDRITGGLYSIETKAKVANERKRERAGWHTHLHAVIFGPELRGFLDQRELSDLWNEVTDGRGRIVDIRGCHRDLEGRWCLRRKQGDDVVYLPVLRECVKYITAGATAKAYDPAASAVTWWDAPAVLEFVQATKGVRLYQTFGSCHGVEVEADPPCLCGRCGESIEVEGGAGSLLVSRSDALRWILTPTMPELAPDLGAAYRDRGAFAFDQATGDFRELELANAPPG